MTVAAVEQWFDTFSSWLFNIGHLWHRCRYVDNRLSILPTRFTHHQAFRRPAASSSHLRPHRRSLCTQCRHRLLLLSGVRSRPEEMCISFMRTPKRYSTSHHHVARGPTRLRVKSRTTAPFTTPIYKLYYPGLHLRPQNAIHVMACHDTSPFTTRHDISCHTCHAHGHSFPLPRSRHVMFSMSLSPSRMTSTSFYATMTSRVLASWHEAKQRYNLSTTVSHV